MLRVIETDWLLSEASVKGKGHVDGGLPNQDYVGIRTSTDGKVIAAVVSDGAGTAPKSEIGSRTTVDFLVPSLLIIGEDVRDGRLSPLMVRDRLMDCILKLRQRLDPSGVSLREFHCTVVACVITPSGGFVCQIGDSIGLATPFLMLDEAQPSRIDFFPDDHCIRYETDRGEYSNETHFVTETDWSQHLRIKPLPDEFDAVALMTDGAMDIATTKGKVFRGFLSNLVSKLVATPDRDARCNIIYDWLANPQTYPVTGDDKTLFLAIRAGSRSLAHLPVFIGDESDTAAPPIHSAQPTTHRHTAQDQSPAPVRASSYRHANNGIETPMRLPAPVPRRKRLIAIAMVALFVATALLVGRLLSPLTPETNSGSESSGAAHAKPAQKAKASSEPVPPPLLASAEPATNSPTAPIKELEPAHPAPSTASAVRPEWTVSSTNIDAARGSTIPLTVTLYRGGDMNVEVGAIIPKGDIDFEKPSTHDCKTIRKLTLAKQPSCEVKIKVAKNAKAGAYSTTIVAYTSPEKRDSKKISIIIKEVALARTDPPAEKPAPTPPTHLEDKTHNDIASNAAASDVPPPKNEEGTGK